MPSCLWTDEKSQIQALDRTQPGLPLKPGKCGTMTTNATARPRFRRLQCARRRVLGLHAEAYRLGLHSLPQCRREVSVVAPTLSTFGSKPDPGSSATRRARERAAVGRALGPFPWQQRVQFVRPWFGPETIRSSTSVSQAIGSTPFSLAVWISVIATAQCRAPPSLPANNAFLRVRIFGLIARSTTFVSISIRPSSRNIDQARPMPDGVADRLGQIGDARNPVDMLVQPAIQGLDNRPTSLVAHPPAVLGGMPADLGLDRIEFANAPQHVGRQRRLGGDVEIVEAPPQVRPAECQRHRSIGAISGQPFEPGIAIDL